MCGGPRPAELLERRRTEAASRGGRSAHTDRSSIRITRNSVAFLSAESGEHESPLGADPTAEIVRKRASQQDGEQMCSVLPFLQGAPTPNGKRLKTHPPPRSLPLAVTYRDLGSGVSEGRGPVTPRHFRPSVMCDGEQDASLLQVKRGGHFLSNTSPPTSLRHHSEINLGSVQEGWDEEPDVGGRQSFGGFAAARSGQRGGATSQQRLAILTDGVYRTRRLVSIETEFAWINAWSRGEDNGNARCSSIPHSTHVTGTRAHGLRHVGQSAQQRARRDIARPPNPLLKRPVTPCGSDGRTWDPAFRFGSASWPPALARGLVRTRLANENDPWKAVVWCLPLESNVKKWPSETDRVPSSP
ncbi:hypothetical protein SKAU_G00348910 [Synaphobranchus kaupii]|uniref:Uncharacterized protein n=1 Tax=Synaphobranchus kaupii TaxID=118154 RepID=A0A9Q1IFU4_SYNKA|nr:hypothetical protein SKAU_G00348910 [Synaphobranchus kaupii]